MTTILHNFSGFSPKQVSNSPNQIFRHLKSPKDETKTPSNKLNTLDYKVNLKKNEFVHKPVENKNKCLSKKKSQEDAASVFEKRSSLEEINEFVEGLLLKEKSKELKGTETFLLKSYIEIFISETILLIKNSNSLNIENLKNEWMRLCKVWCFYKIKEDRFSRGCQDICKLGKIEKNFKSLENEMAKIENKKTNLEEVRKGFKKFCFDLTN